MACFFWRSRMAKLVPELRHIRRFHRVHISRICLDKFIPPPGTSIFLPKVCWKIFLFPRCDMLVPWRVCFWHEIPPQSIFESAKISSESQRLEFFRLSRWPVQVWPIFVQENRWMNFDKSCLLETFQTLVALFGVFVHPPMVLPAPCPAFSGLVRAGLGPRTPSRAGTFFLSIGI